MPTIDVESIGLTYQVFATPNKSGTLTVTTPETFACYVRDEVTGIEWKFVRGTTSSFPVVGRHQHLIFPTGSGTIFYTFD